MATRLYSRNAVLLAKIETTEGTDAVPTGAANAVLCSELSIEPLAGSSVDLAYVRPYFGKSPSIRTENYVVLNLTCDLAGPGTGGLAAPHGQLLRACGMSETLLAAPVTGSAQAGAASSITLAAAASAVDNAYAGMELSITSGTGSGQTRDIIAYNGTTKVATVEKAFAVTPAAASGYSIAANSSYNPVSTAFESVTIYYNQNGVRHKALGCRGTFTIDMSGNARPTIKFTLTGMYGGIADGSETGVVYSQWKTPVPVNNINSSALVQGKTTDGTATGIQLQSFTMDIGNSVAHRMLVGAENVVLTDRQVSGTISIEATTVTFNDWWTQVVNGTTNPFFIENGTVAGNVVSVLGPKVQLTDPKYTDSDGVVMLELTVNFIPNIGNDEFRLTFS